VVDSLGDPSRKTSRFVTGKLVTTKLRDQLAGIPVESGTLVRRVLPNDDLLGMEASAIDIKGVVATSGSHEEDNVYSAVWMV
jgi:hypothetical protein